MLNINSVVIVGGYYSHEYYADEISNIRTGAQMAAVNFEKSLLDGVGFSLLGAPTFISAPYLPSYPKGCRSVYVKKRAYSTKEYRFIGVSYLNFPIIKNFIKFFNILKELRRVRRTAPPDVVICNTLNLGQLAAVASASLLKRCTRAVVIMDLPIFPGDCGVMHKLYLKYIEWPLAKLALSKFDYFIVATTGIATLLNLPESKFSLLDGIYSPYNQERRTNGFSIKKTSKRLTQSSSIMYAGSLDERYGVKSFINSFHADDSLHVDLVICGSGPLAEYIKEIAKKDRRIHYLGVLPVDRLRQLQMEVDLLVNPRASSGEYNFYSFPSKTLEYMASGTPVLMNKLPCMSSEYNDLVYFRKENENFTEAVKRVLLIPVKEKKQRASSARSFVLLNKTSNKQVERILSQIEALRTASTID